MLGLKLYVPPCPAKINLANLGLVECTDMKLLMWKADCSLCIFIWYLSNIGFFVCLCFCVYMWGCMRVGVQVCSFMSMYVGVRAQHQMFAYILYLIGLRQCSLWPVSSPLARLADLQGLEPHLSLTPRAETSVTANHDQFLADARNSNTDPHACEACALTPEISSQSYSTGLVKWIEKF